ncbi:hypothetical protein JAAARDRAFT_192659 [Jaapia argillacea MUCL 33604]|uniref:Actin-like ATPase domain-containing protein n=1 Tax=Jaapia argillacea MUCL 33604 TaxID=933084 RepID=A0A067PWM5_9AGAM|nr:hypothetical protein JAAARDRAFT_192659 [Jaapia argillacea MUCL 33604]
MSRISRQPYSGNRRKLVFGFDIGTTFSGISYSILDPGEIPTIRSVTKYPGQSNSGGDSKVPSIICYDSDDSVCEVGEEAYQACESGEADLNGWTEVKWFKLHLRPTNTSASRIAAKDIPPLPTNMTVVDVLADFMAYLYRCGLDFIRDTHHAGDQILKSVDGQIEFVFGHPNGWEGSQQEKMRQAAVLAGLIPNTSSGRSRLQFVTEGEASLHYCVNNGFSSGLIKTGASVMIVDCGGGTIDLSSFAFKEVNPISVEEIAPVGCRLQGAVFVSNRAEAYLLEKLRGSGFDTPQDVRKMVKFFDQTIKKRFKGTQKTALLQFGGTRDNAPDYGINRGAVKLTGAEIVRLFEPSLEAILGAIEEQRRTTHRNVQDILMVGGFAANDWLFQSLRESLKLLGFNLSRPDGFTNKAVADGAMSFYLDHFVSARVARATYGSYITWNFDPKDLEHVRRFHSKYTDVDGVDRLPGGFCSIVKKGTSIAEQREFRSSFSRVAKNVRDLRINSCQVTVYRGTNHDTQWSDVEPDKFESLGIVSADLSGLLPSLSRQTSPTGSTYFKAEFDIILFFGRTELQAFIAWIEKGQEKRYALLIISINIPFTYEPYLRYDLGESELKPPSCMIIQFDVSDSSLVESEMYLQGF